MLYIVLSVIGMACFVHTFKFAQARRQNALMVGAVNYVVAAVAAATLFLMGDRPAINPTVLVMGVLTGVGYVAALLILFMGLAGSGSALSGMMMSLSVLIPVVFSATWYGDMATPMQISGIALTLMALPLIGVRPRANPQASRPPSLWVLVGLFAINGAIQCPMRVAHGMAPGSGQAHAYIMALFAGAAVSIIVVAGMKRQLPKPKELATGSLMGVANVVANLPAVLALGSGSGPVVFATRAGAGALLTVALSVLLWHERLRRASWFGIAVGVAALVLINLKA